MLRVRIWVNVRWRKERVIRIMPYFAPHSKLKLGTCIEISVRGINLLLTERKGRTGEYWPEVVTVWTKCSEVRTKTTEGQYSPVRLELARLVSSLLYGTRVNNACLFSVKTHFRSLEFKGLPLGVFDDASNSKRTSYHEFQNKCNERKSCWI